MKLTGWLLIALLLLPFKFAIAAPASGADPHPGRERYAVCRKALSRAQAEKVLYSVKWRPPEEPRVLTGTAFFELPIDAKTDLAKVVNCYLIDGANGCISFNLSDFRDGKPIARWSSCKLTIY